MTVQQVESHRDAPPALTAGERWRSSRLPAAMAVGGLGSLVLLHLRDPHQLGSYGYCPIRAATGLWCPGCGGLRALNDLTNLDVRAAVSSNVAVVVLVFVVGVAFLAWLPRRWRGEPGRMLVLNTRTAMAAVTLIWLFTIVRNTPWGSSLAP